MTEQLVSSSKERTVLKFLRKQLREMFDQANENLRRLDNGGYEVTFNGTIQRLENSDVKIKRTYVDRLNKNVTKKFKHSNIFAHTFTFQEAVEKMPGRYISMTRLYGFLKESPRPSPQKYTNDIISNGAKTRLSTFSYFICHLYLFHIVIMMKYHYIMFILYC